MCGIFGVLGPGTAPQMVHAGLKRLEYRGYDSCGIAWLDDGHLRAAKAVGALVNLPVPQASSTRSIGHTRWATHGGVTEANAHPHLDTDGTVAVVHNGVLLNHVRLRRALESAGVTMRSETDSELLAHLWSRAEGDPWRRLAALKQELAGTYSVAFLLADGRVAVAKHRNPLWLARIPGGIAFSSDAAALAPLCKEAVPLEDGDEAVLDADGWTIHGHDGRPVDRPAASIEGLADLRPLAGYGHHMLKEIHEAPVVLNRSLARHLAPFGVKGLPDLGGTRVRAIGAGTSHHAGLLTAAWMRRLARLPADAVQSPESKDDVDIPEPGTCLVAFTQSGETLDTVQALVSLRSRPMRSVVVTNRPVSTLGRMADATVQLDAGTEVSVAATKSFLAQALMGYLMALHEAATRGVFGSRELSARVEALVRLPREVQRTLYAEPEFMEVARGLAGHEHVFVLAKGLLVPVAMEGALKLKEVAYQHAEAYPAGELKHGPFALLEESTLVVFLVSGHEHVDAVCNSIQEVMSRGSRVLAIAPEGVEVPCPCLRVPASPLDHEPIVMSTAVHLLSYWVAKARGLPIDRPRNLAKSVTVE